MWVNHFVRQRMSAGSCRGVELPWGTRQGADGE